MNVQTINDIYFYNYLLKKISEFYKNDVASYKTEKFTTRWNLQKMLHRAKPKTTILYPELSFLLRYTPSLSTPILQDFCKI
jgi:hypothetical protein